MLICFQSTLYDMLRVGVFICLINGFEIVKEYFVISPYFTLLTGRSKKKNTAGNKF